jgi:CspA family cold shock protein
LAGQSGRLAFATRRAHVQTLSKDRAPKAARVAPPNDRVRADAKGISMTNGTVKFYNVQKGFGFIQPDNGGPDVFVHATALERSGVGMLNEGQKVAFDTQVDRRTGKTAVGNIQLA